MKTTWCRKDLLCTILANDKFLKSPADLLWRGQILPQIRPSPSTLLSVVVTSGSGTCSPNDIDPRNKRRAWRCMHSYPVSITITINGRMGQARRPILRRWMWRWRWVSAVRLKGFPERNPEPFSPIFLGHGSLAITRFDPPNLNETPLEGWHLVRPEIVSGLAIGAEVDSLILVEIAPNPTIFLLWITTTCSTGHVIRWGCRERAGAVLLLINIVVNVGITIVIFVSIMTSTSTSKSSSSVIGGGWGTRIERKSVKTRSGRGWNEIGTMTIGEKELHLLTAARTVGLRPNSANAVVVVWTTAATTMIPLVSLLLQPPNWWFPITLNIRRRGGGWGRDDDNMVVQEAVDEPPDAPPSPSLTPTRTRWRSCCYNLCGAVSESRPSPNATGHVWYIHRRRVCGICGQTNENELALVVFKRVSALLLLLVPKKK